MTVPAILQKPARQLQGYSVKSAIRFLWERLNHDWDRHDHLTGGDRFGYVTVGELASHEYKRNTPSNQIRIRRNQSRRQRAAVEDGLFILQESKDKRVTAYKLLDHRASTREIQAAQEQIDSMIRRREISMNIAQRAAANLANLRDAPPPESSEASSLKLG